MTRNAEFVVQIMIRTILENEQYFSELDGVVGNGDFGYSIARGFEKVEKEWDNLDHGLPGSFLKKIAGVIIGSVGGVSGSIWGTAFLRAGGALGDSSEITPPRLIAMFRAAIEGIKKRGNADLGDKTLLDALVPAVDRLEQALAEGNQVQAARAVHTLNGLAGTIGAHALRDAAQQMERGIHSPQANRYLPEVAHRLRALVAALQPVIARDPVVHRAAPAADPTAQRKAVDRLVQLLRASDANAQRHFSEHEGLLRVVLGEHFTHVQHAVNSLALDEALEVMEAIST